MTSQLTVHEALDRVPGWHRDETRVEELSGGLTNRVYRLRSNAQEGVLRLDAEAQDAVGPDRRFELEIMDAAAKAGIAPAILFADVDAGILVTEYLHGTVWQASDLESERNIEALALLLRRVHELPKCGSAMDVARIAGKYAAFLDAHLELRAFAETCVQIVTESPVPHQVTCCHNDVVATNVVDCGGLKLLDWEYACDNEPLFDLASLIGFHDFDKSRRDALLGAYTGGIDTELQERLGEQLRVYDALQWLWLATRQVRLPQKEQTRRLGVLQQRIR